jgi:hypothetical protein
VEELEMVRKAGVHGSKEIYGVLMEKVTQKNESLIPSRNENKVNGIKWSVVWKNLKIMKGVNAEEKFFVWKSTQDMSEVGYRIRRKNAQRSCQRLTKSGLKCEENEDIYHCLSECEVVEETFMDLK